MFVTGEDEPVDYGRRMSAWIETFCEGKPVRPGVGRNVTFVNLAGADIKLVVRDRRDFAPDLPNAEGIANRVRHRTPRPDLVVIETASIFGGDETNQAHAAFVEACKRIAISANTAVVIVSHTGKQNARENAFDAYASRGGSALADNARGTIVFGRMPDDPKTQRRLLGRPAMPEEKHDYILKLARATFAPKQPAVILRPRSVLDCLVLQEVDPLTSAEVATIRARKNALLHFAVSEILKTGKPATMRELRKSIPNLSNGIIAFRDIADCIEDAVADGVLAFGPRGKRGNTPIVLGKVRPVPQNGAVEKESFEITIPFGEGIKEIG